MSNLNNINNKLNKIKKDFLTQNPRKVLMFVDADELPIRKVKLQYNKKEKIIICQTEEEWNNLLDTFVTYDKMIFIQVKKSMPNDVIKY